MSACQTASATIKLGDALEEFDQRLGDRAEPEVLTLTEKNGFVAQRERFNKRLAIADTSGYKVIGLHDIAFNPYLLWASAIAQNTAWTTAIISPLYPTFHVRKGYDPRFINYVLHSGSVRSLYDGISFGSVPRKRRASVQDFLSLRIPAPPALPEQRRISEVLDRVQALRTKRRVALAQHDTLIQGIFLDLFGDPATNPKGWEMLRVQDVLSMPLRNGLSPSNVGKVTAKVLTLSAITGSEFDDSAWKVSTFRSPPPPDQSVDENDFLICRGNGNVRLVGKGYFPTRRMPDVTFPDTMIAARVRTERVERVFLQHIWGWNAVRRQVESLARTTNGTFKVNQTMLEGITFIGPPPELQREFARRVGATDKMKAAQRTSLAELDALFAVLQHRAFRGEL